MLTREVKRELINQVKSSQVRRVMVPKNNLSRRPVDSKGATRAAFKYLGLKQGPTVESFSLKEKLQGRRVFQLLPTDGREYVSAYQDEKGYTIHSLDGTDKTVPGSTKIRFTFTG